MENTLEKSRLIKAGFVLLIILSAYYATKIITEVKGYAFIGGGIPPSNMMTFDGKGEVTAKPDLATISFTLSDTEKDLKTAQDKVTAKETAVLAFLDTQKIDKKDIKTEDYNSYPQYEYRNAVCPQIYQMSGVNTGMPTYCPPGKSVLTGYQVSESISVKVHDITISGDIVKGLGTVGVSNINGPSFSIENEDALRDQARKIAIDDAKAKAATLSKDLGVNLVRIVNFSDNNNYPSPSYYSKDLMAQNAVGAAAPAPALPTGENKITSNVTITYEIR